jgi:peptide-methionine (S)-S-oxide reductase
VKIVKVLGILLCCLLTSACGGEGTVENKSGEEPVRLSGKVEQAIFGAGCFWCTEAVFEIQPGVLSAESGYMGGNLKDPTYRDVSKGTSGHAEVTRVTFDPEVITYGRLLEIFWIIHDPTTLNRQGADVGSQYRSVIFYTTEAQRVAAEESMAEVSKRLTSPVVTEIVAAKDFYPAEAYHQDYYKKNPDAAYCRMVIDPKLKKLKKP